MCFEITAVEICDNFFEGRLNNYHQRLFRLFFICSTFFRNKNEIKHESLLVFRDNCSQVCVNNTTWKIGFHRSKSLAIIRFFLTLQSFQFRRLSFIIDICNLKINLNFWHFNMPLNFNSIVDQDTSTNL